MIWTGQLRVLIGEGEDHLLRGIFILTVWDVINDHQSFDFWFVLTVQYDIHQSLCGESHESIK